MNNLFIRTFKFLQSNLHALLTKFEDPVKLTEQGLRDLKKDFDESMKNVAKVKAISIGAKKDIEVKTQIAKDYEQKALILLKKAQNNELEQAEAERLATEALNKKHEALSEVKRLSAEVKNYDVMLKEMEKKILDLKNQIQKWESEYASLKARATVAKTTKKINLQLSALSSDSTTAMLEEMKTRISEEENLAQAYGETAMLETSVDEEINKAIGYSPDAVNELTALKQQLLENKDTDKALTDNLDELKKELDS